MQKLYSWLAEKLIIDLHGATTAHEEKKCKCEYIMIWRQGFSLP
jgi:hypothetical protein